MICLFNKYKKSVQKRTDFFDNSFFNAVPDKPLATRNKPHNNQLCADLSRFISAYPVVSHFLRFAWQTTDGCDSLRARADSCDELKKASSGKNTNKDEYARIACEQWIDVRSFGQVFAFRGDAVSVGVRGPVSISIAKSVSPIEIISMQITKSVNGESGKNGKASDTMGTKNRVGFGLYVFKGSINCQLAEKTGFSDEDAEKIKKALVTLFENDCSSARPEGSMQVCRVYWWKHDGKTPKVSSAKIHNAVQIKEKAELNGNEPNSVADYDIILNNPEGAVQPEIIDNI